MSARPVRTCGPQSSPDSAGDDDPDAQVLDCHYPIIHRSNQEPRHFLDGFVEYLNEVLGLRVRVTDFQRRPAHLRRSGTGSPDNQAREARTPPFWLSPLVASSTTPSSGGTPMSLPAVVDHFATACCSCRSARTIINHPANRGAWTSAGEDPPPVDPADVPRAGCHLRREPPDAPGGGGRRESQACPRTGPCVVVAGGREPPAFHRLSAPPVHSHRRRARRCCDNGGCWKSRTRALGDGDSKDAPEELCVGPRWGRCPAACT